MANDQGLAHTLPKIVEAVGRVYREEGKDYLFNMISSATVAVRETSYDNWNGGTYGYTLELQVPAAAFARLGDQVEKIEQDLVARITKLARVYPNEGVEAVVISPTLVEQAQSVATEPSRPATFWQDGYFRLFISHVSAEKLVASALAADLAAFGISGFVAHEDIKPTKAWEDEIRLALTTCDALVCLLTPDFPASNWTDQEVGFAMGRGILVVPIRLGVDPYGFMARHQGYAGLNLSRESLARGLVEILAKHDESCVRMASALVTAFELSGSFAAAKVNANNLSLVRTWSTELADRVRGAVENNYQIAQSWGVPERIRSLLSAVPKSGA